MDSMKQKLHKISAIVLKNFLVLKRSKILILFVVFCIAGSFGVWRVTRHIEEGRSLQDFFKKNEQAALVESDFAREVPYSGALRVPIFVYHIVRPHYVTDSAMVRKYDVEPDVLAKELQYLHDNGYTTITPDDLVRNAADGVPLPLKSVIITFDDGWEMQFHTAFPLLKKYGITATFYIFTNVIDRKEHFLTWTEIKEMEAAGMVIGGHTKTHPYLAKISDIAMLRDEIAGGKKIIEEHLGHSITAFAVPFGHSSDAIKAIAKEAGYTSLRTMYKGEYYAKDDLFFLKSIEAPNDLGEFIKLLGQ